MNDDDAKVGRRSTDADLAVVIERLDTLTEKVDMVHEQTSKTNGRVSELEVKERIRQDREEQRAITSAAAEAAKYRVEQAAVEERHETQRQQLTRRDMWLGVLALMCSCAATIFGAMIAAGHIQL